MLPFVFGSSAFSGGKAVMTLAMQSELASLDVYDQVVKAVPQLMV